MEDHQLIDDIDELNPAIVSIHNIMPMIVTIFFALPLSCLCYLKIKEFPAKNNELTEHLLGNIEKESPIQPSDSTTVKSISVYFKYCCP